MQFNRRTVIPRRIIFFIFSIGFSLHSHAHKPLCSHTREALSTGPGAANGTYKMQFSLFDAATGTGQIGSAVTNSSVTAANGIFTVNLNLIAPNALTGARAGSN